nr:MFS transporter [Malonomonas rubra]
MSQDSESFLHQPKAVWASAFACVVGFMSIGLVDPILTSIAAGLHASASQVSLLFTSYFLVTSLMMLLTGFVSSRLGGRKTLLLGAALIVIFSALAGTSDSIAELVGYRAGWGLGNAFFVVTALSVIVASSRGGTTNAILMYEAALGLGISVGPLLGAALGAHSWRYPFFGTATLMAIGFIAILLMLPEQPKPMQKTSLTAPIRALSHGGLLTAASSAFCYNFAFFTILAFVPFVLQMSAHTVGLIFFGWGLLLAIFSVLIAPRLQNRFSALQILTVNLGLLAMLLLVMAYSSPQVVAVCVVLSGAVIGVCSTVYTEIALEISTAPRPVASAGYNFVRWFAGVVAPFVAPLLAEHFSPLVTFWVAAIAAVLAPLVLISRRATLGHYGRSPSVPQVTLPATPGGIMVALPGDRSDSTLLARAIELATTSRASIQVVHVRTFEAFEGSILELETVAQSQQLVISASERLVRAGLQVTSNVLETSTAQLVTCLLEQIEYFKPSRLILGRGTKRSLGHLRHGSLADSLNRLAAADLELILVPLQVT